MQWNELAREDCSLARSLAVLGDRWTLLVLREAFLRTRRFDDFEQKLGIARRVLSERLALLESTVPLPLNPATVELKPFRSSVAPEATVIALAAGSTAPLSLSVPPLTVVGPV